MAGQANVFAGVTTSPGPLRNVGKSLCHLGEHLRVLPVELDIANAKVIGIDRHVLRLIGASRLTEASRISRGQTRVDRIAVAQCDVCPHPTEGIRKRAFESYRANRETHPVQPRSSRTRHETDDWSFPSRTSKNARTESA